MHGQKDIELKYAAKSGDLDRFKKLIADGAQVRNVPNILYSAVKRGHTNIVDYILSYDLMRYRDLSHDIALYREVGEDRDVKDSFAVYSDTKKNFAWYCDIENAIFRAIRYSQLEIVDLFLKHGISSRQELIVALESGAKEIARYLIEQDTENIFDLRLEEGLGSLSILAFPLAGRHGLLGEDAPYVLDLLVTRYPQLLVEDMGGHSLGPIIPLHYALEHADVKIIKVMKRYLKYIDINMYYHDYVTGEKVEEPMLNIAICHHPWKQNGTGEHDSKLLHEIVRFFVAYGADVNAKGDSNEIARDRLKRAYPEWLDAFDEAVKEGLEIWRWNQQVMREVVRWSGCVVMEGGGGDGVGTSRGMCSVVGIGKRAVDTLVQFAPAQFEEKLEMGTVQLLCAQAMLEMGHGIVFGDVHHGGYVKYVGTTSKGVTLHGWNATVTCDYHIEVKMTGWCEMHGQHSVGYDGGHSGDPTHGGKMPYGMQYSAHVTHMHMTRIVMADGDSYVDHKVTVMTDMWELASHMSVLLCTEMENGWVYNDKLCLQKNGAGQYALENEHAQGDGTMHVWGQGHDVNHGAVVVMGMHKLASHMYDKQGVVSYLRVWGGDAYDQKLYAQQQWYAETGEVLPTLAVMTQSHHDMITALDNPCQLQHSAHAHDEAAQQYIPQVVPQLMHTSPQHHLQLHIPHDELQQDANVHHIVNFLHSISML